MRAMRRRLYLKIGACAFLAVFGFLLFFHSTDEVDNLMKIKIMERSIRSAINQGECRRPHLPIDNPEIMKFYKPVEKINCGSALDDWVKCEKSLCFVKPEILSSHGEVVCSYTDLIRKSDYKVKFGKTTKTKQPYVLEAADFVHVVCGAEDGQSWHGMAHGIRDNVKRTIPPPEISIPVEGLSVDAPAYYNVLIYGFDSLSRNAFMRKLPKSYEYLTKELGAVVLKGYNIVGDGTPQALVPLLTGYTELELPETRTRMPNSNYVDVYPMIWHEYKKHGYVTSFNEDVPKYGTFTYRMNGFSNQPTDHYLRTYYVEAANSWSSKPKCIGHQPDHIVMLDYTKNFMSKYNDSPRFIFSFHGGLSHDSINLVGAADDDVLEWLCSLKAKHLLNDTILIFMADHGNRFSSVRATLQGKQEERLPFFSFTFPESFKKRFPEQYANFLENSERLTTPFDIHETLRDILKLQKSLPMNSKHHMETSTKDDLENLPTISNLASQRAISLFESIPKNRSCADAYIEPHWCACLNWKTLPLDDPAYTGVILRMANSILNAINNATSQYRSICSPLELKKVNWALQLIPHKALLQYKSISDKDGYMADLTDKMNVDEIIYQLQVVVDPGESLFEASVAYNIHNLTAVTKLSEISRVNKYGKQADCIYERNPELRKYCYCT